MNRGSSPRARFCPWASGSFNEAPIHESGKCETRSQDNWQGPSFNEAPIHESGK